MIHFCKKQTIVVYVFFKKKKKVDEYRPSVDKVDSEKADYGRPSDSCMSTRMTFYYIILYCS